MMEVLTLSAATTEVVSEMVATLLGLNMLLSLICMAVVFDCDSYIRLQF